MRPPTQPFLIGRVSKWFFRPSDAIWVCSTPSDSGFASWMKSRGIHGKSCRIHGKSCKVLRRGLRSPLVRSLLHYFKSHIFQSFRSILQDFFVRTLRFGTQFAYILRRNEADKNETRGCELVSAVFNPHFQCCRGIEPLAHWAT